MQRRFESDIFLDFSYFHGLSMIKNQIRFLDNWFINPLDFLFFIQGKLRREAKYNIATYDLDFSGTVSYAKKYIESPSYGYFSVALSQNSKLINQNCVSNNLNSILAKLGGYSTVMTGLVSFLLSSYQSFTFDKSMLKKLYHQRDKDYDDKDENGNLKDDDAEMIERIKNRRIFWFGYWGYMLMSFTTKCCCCLKNRWLRTWPYY